MRLKALLEPFGISHFYTDGWGAYERQGNRILIEFSNYCKCLENLTAQFQL
jgi:IS1 family transposase